MNRIRNAGKIHMGKAFLKAIAAYKAVWNMWNSIKMIREYRIDLKEKIVVTKKMADILKRRVKKNGPDYITRQKRAIKA